MTHQIRMYRNTHRECEGLKDSQDETADSQTSKVGGGSNAKGDDT